MTFADLKVSEFLDALANSEPTPGGGTASAVAGAMGASLMFMVTGLAKSRTNGDEEKAALAQARGPLGSIRDRLVRLAEDDSSAFDAVMAAYRLPKASDAERAARATAIEHSLQHATVVPLETLRACAQALEIASVVAANGNRSAASDVGVAIGLLEAAAEGAEANVRINLGGLKDEVFRRTTGAESARLLAHVAAGALSARTRL